MKRMRRFNAPMWIGRTTMLVLVLALAVKMVMPLSLFSAQLENGLPQPGERLAAGGIWDEGRGSTAQLMDGHDGARIVIHPLDRLAEVYRYEAIIYGGAVEFHGEAVLIYANGHRIYPVRELFADGERLTFFVDHTQGVLAELYVQFRRVNGTRDSVLYVLAIGRDGSTLGLSSADDFFVDGSKSSPYQPSREIGTGSISSIFTSPIAAHGTPRERFGSSGRVRTTPATRPNQPTTPEVTPDPTPPPTDPPMPPTPTPTPRPTPAPTIQDPTLSSWARAGVETAIRLGLVPEGLQSVYNTPITRAEFAALVVRFYESIRGEITGRVAFADTVDVSVEKVAYIGVVSGIGNNRFAPDNLLTREQAAVILARLSNALGQPLPIHAPIFADNDSISSWAREGVGQIQAAGIMSGVGNNRFAPRSLFTREQSIITILRFLDE